MRVLRPAYIELAPGRKKYIKISIYFENSRDLSIDGDYTALFSPKIIPAKKYSCREINKLRKVLYRWNGNWRKQGTERQEDLLTELYERSGFSQDFPRTAIQKMSLLETHGLLSDAGHVYGSRRRSHPIPREIVEYLFTLPQCGKKDTWDVIRYRMFDPIPNEDLQSILDS